MKWTSIGDPRVRPEHRGEPSLELVPAPAFITAALFCPDCEDWHYIQVIVHQGRIPDSFALGIGPGAGHWYRLTGENRGAPEGISVPVYRATCSITEAIVADLRAQRSGVVH